MSTRQHAQVRVASVLTLISAALLLALSPARAQAQEGAKPQRGFHPAGAYALGDIETINTTNGNLNVRLPMAALPPGRGGKPGVGITLHYNSKN
jgi:hypothetical protein